jgi:protein tyrosine phosphatase
VRLARPPGGAAEFDDYVNASHVQPACTRRRYIATQGPLPETFADFWALVWAQDVRVLVMLTREREGAQTKCARYWTPGTHGALTLTRVDPGSPSEAPPAAAAGGFFTAEDTGGRTVRREFELRRAGAPPRRVTQLQYTGWDDMHVPADAHEVLDVVRAVRAVQPDDDGPPVLVHCSAGIGRTGGFIALDAALDAVRRDVRAHLPPPPPPPADEVEVRRPGVKRLVSDVGVAGRGGAGAGVERSAMGTERSAMGTERGATGTERAPDPFRMHAGLASGAAGGRSPLPTPAAERPPVLPALTEERPPTLPTPTPTPGEECYRAPRALHTRGPPAPLGSLHALVADMREQRMSLVQTLRQYVFVHLAVLQGALEIAEEEADRR